MDPLLQAVQIGAHRRLKDFAVREPRAEHLQRGEFEHIVVLASVRLVPTAVQLQNVNRWDGGKAQTELVPHRHEPLAVLVSRDVEHHEDVRAGVIRGMDEVVELPRPYLRSDVKHVVPANVRAFALWPEGRPDVVAIHR